MCNMPTKCECFLLPMKKEAIFERTVQPDKDTKKEVSIVGVLCLHITSWSIVLNKLVTEEIEMDKHRHEHTEEQKIKRF